VETKGSEEECEAVLIVFDVTSATVSFGGMNSMSMCTRYAFIWKYFTFTFSREIDI